MSKPKTVACLGKTNTEYVWVVTYWDCNTAPVVTVFDNEVVANEFYNYSKNLFHVCCLDKCPIYSAFKITGIMAEGVEHDKRTDT